MAWSSNVNDGGDLSVVNNPPPLAGSYSLRALVDDANSIYVLDQTPAAEANYNARFLFFLFSMNGTGTDITNLTLFETYQANGTSVANVKIKRYTSGSSYYYKVSAGALNDASQYQAINEVNLGSTNAAHQIEIGWKAATASGANNGELKLWLDSQLIGTLSNLDNDTLRVESARLGVLSVTGSFYNLPAVLWDSFASTRGTYIGP